MQTSPTLFCIVLIAATLAFTAPSHAKMYRWVDAEGLIFYSDKVPPQHSKFERAVINEQGHVLETVKAAKTKEQIALEIRLRKLRKEQEKLIARQKSNDKVLLSTFRSIEDLRMTLNSKLNSIDAQKRVHEKTLKNLSENLEAQRKKAAVAERNGKKVPSNVLTKIATIEDKMKATHIAIGDILIKRDIIEAKFNADIQRFLFLTKSSAISAQELSDEAAELTAANTLGLYNCKNNQSCEQAWAIAKQFVRLNSTTPINFNTAALVMASDPMNSTDISLSASKSKRNNNKMSIFLDIRCHKSSLGNEYCQSEKVKDIRESFRLYIESGLGEASTE